MGGQSLNGCLYIGNGTSIEQNCHIIAAYNLSIGKDCVISANVYISDCNHRYDENKRIIDSTLEVKRTNIADNVFIGIGAKIMPGVSIGERSVIGANAVVTRDVPPYQIWGGVPAKYIKDNALQSCSLVGEL